MKVFFIICGVISICMGLGCMLRDRVLNISLRSTWLGTFWRKHIGERWGLGTLRFFYGLAQILIGAGFFCWAYYDF